jgi:DNA-binding transcriptional regulator YdaS (Cro superfamily)
MLAPGHIHRDAPRTLVDNDRRLKAITKEFQAYIGNHQSQLARRIGVASQTVNLWFNKAGRISATGAIAIGKHFPEWPRERLRPDIVDWSTYE